MELISRRTISNWTRVVFVGLLAAVLLPGSRMGVPTSGKAAVPALASTHLGVPVADMVSTGPVFVDPGESATVLTVPQGKVFVLTDVVVFPEVGASDPDFLASYNLEEGNLVKFKFRTTGTGTNQSHHFVGGITFSSGSPIRVAVDYFTGGRMFFQLSGYFITP